MKIVSEHLPKNKSFFNVLMLLTIAICLGTYHIITTVVIAEDGVNFIQYAQQLETSRVETMVKEFQHPGYPLLILLSHNAAYFVYKNISILSWIYCGQIVTLMFRLLAITALYFVGRKFCGAKMSFWGVLIFILLPKPAKFGSDVLSDWPHLFFLSLGFLFLMLGATTGKWWPFGLAGVSSGLGYLIRPECAQLVIFGTLWLVLQMFLARRFISRSRAVLALSLLFAGFLIPAGPYMKLKGAVFPKKDIGRFELSMRQRGTYNQYTVQTNSVNTAGFLPRDIARASGKLFEQAGDLLMWIFLPPFLVGAYKVFKKRDWCEPVGFFIVALIALNIPLMIWLYCKHSYISGRHILPLLAFTIFCVPAGLEIFGNWLSSGFSKNRLEINKNQHLWFFILLCTGLSVCVPKLVTPLHAEKRSYRDVAQWLEEHTDEKTVIAAPDTRIGFYARRSALKWTNGQIPAQAQYAVKIIKKEDNEAVLPEQIGKIVYKYPDEKSGDLIIVILRQS